MFKDFRKYVISIDDTTAAQQRELTTLLKQAGEVIYYKSRLLEGDNTLSGWFGHDGTDWCKISPSTSSVNKISMTIAINILKEHLNDTDKGVKVEVGEIYLNSAGAKNEILEILDTGIIKYRHQGGNTYFESQENILKNWRLCKTAPIKNKRYKVGDKVKVRADLKEDVTYWMNDRSAKDYATRSMANLKGKVVTISTENANGKNKYFIRENSSYWTDEMFEGLAEETTPTELAKYLDRAPQVGDWVERIKNNPGYSGPNPGLVIGTEDYAVEFEQGKWDLDNYLVLNPLHQAHPDHPNNKKQQASNTFKAGDLVQLKSKSIIGKKYNNVTLLDNMVHSIKPGMSKVTSIAPNGGVIIDTGYTYGIDCLELYKGKKEVIQVDEQSSNPTPVQPDTAKVKKETKTKKSKQEGKTIMNKVKDVAKTTVEQNKQALVIAGKVEAGRIVNKQILKQLEKVVPFFAKGYLKHPAAPFLAANMVAFAGNYSDNTKVKKLGELMMLGAADAGISALNLDKIIDDILANAKLPAGILDDADEE